jgi:hypothetical protein
MEDIFRRINRILNPGGHMNIIILDSDSEKILEDKSNLDVGGKTIRRTVYGYSREFVTGAAQNAGFVFTADGKLDDFLVRYGWRSYIFKLGRG